MSLWSAEIGYFAGCMSPAKPTSSNFYDSVDCFSNFHFARSGMSSSKCVTTSHTSTQTTAEWAWNKTCQLKKWKLRENFQVMYDVRILRDRTPRTAAAVTYEPAKLEPWSIEGQVTAKNGWKWRLSEMALIRIADKSSSGLRSYPKKKLDWRDQRLSMEAQHWVACTVWGMGRCKLY